MSHQNLLEAGSFVYQYKIISYLSSGGMGDVYSCYDTSEDRLVAIKFLSSSYYGNREMLTRFEREAKILKSIQHKNIVQIYDSGQFQGIPYIVMEYVDGESLFDRVRDRKTTLKSSLQIVMQLLAGTHELHSKSIIHRDIKPSNILILPDFTVKLLDFGISKILDEYNSTLTTAGDIVGSIKYITPEQATQGISCPQSDIRNIGITFYEMLVWNYPFKFNSKYELFNQIKNESVSFPIEPIVPQEIQNIIYKMTALSLMNRYKNIHSVVYDLNQLNLEEIYKLDEHRSNEIKIDPADISSQTNSNPPFPQKYEQYFSENNKLVGAIASIFLVIFVTLFFYFGWPTNSTLEAPTQTALNESTHPQPTDELNKKNVEKISDSSNPPPQKQLAKINTSIKKQVSKPKIKVTPRKVTKRRTRPILKRRNYKKVRSPRVSKSLTTPTLENFESRVTLNHQASSPSTALLKWNSPTSITSHQVLVSSDPQFKKISFNKIVHSYNFVKWAPPTPGVYHWKVRSLSKKIKGSYSRIGQITVNNSVPILKVNKLNSVRTIASVRDLKIKPELFQIKWDHKGGPVHYIIQVSKDPLFKHTLVSKTLSKNYFNHKMKKEGSHYLRVAQIDPNTKRYLSSFSQPQKLNLKTKFKLFPPELKLPEHEQSFSERFIRNEKPIRFSWTLKSGAHQYQIQVSENRNFHRKKLDIRLILNYHNMQRALLPGKYYWRVRSINEDGISKWSSPRYFLVEK